MTVSRPQLRIGDQERTTLCELLSAHFEAGRLDADEFSQRLDAALRARNRAEAATLLEDLPPQKPRQQGQPPDVIAARQRATDRWIGVGKTGVGVAIVIAVHVVIGMLALAASFESAVFIFSIVGGALAAFIGGGTMWLITSPAQPAQPGPQAGPAVR